MASAQTGWSRWYDDAPTHPKFLAAGHKAGWLYLCGQAYASKHATDGLIPKAIVPRLSDVPAPMKVAKKLVEVGLWHDRGDHFEQHDFTEMQTTAEEREAKRRNKSKGGSVGNHVRHHVNRGIVNPDCVHCDSDGNRSSDRRTVAAAIPNLSQRGSAESESESEKEEEEGARPEPMGLLASLLPSRHRADLDVFPGRPRLAAALDAAVDAGWPPGLAVAAVLAGSLDTARSVGAVLVARAETLARQKPPDVSPDVPCPDCNGAGIRWSDAGTTAWPCAHPNVRSTA